MEPYSNNFGARLRSLIQNKGLSLLQFAQQYGIAESQLHNWLKRSDPPLAKHWKRLAAFFGVSVDYLVSGTPQKEERVAEGIGEDKLAGAIPPLDKPQPAELLRREVRQRLEEALTAARDDLSRLGWIREQILGALRLPSHWEEEDAIGDETHLSPLHSKVMQRLVDEERAAKAKEPPDQSKAIA